MTPKALFIRMTPDEKAELERLRVALGLRTYTGLVKLALRELAERTDADKPRAAA